MHATTRVGSLNNKRLLALLGAAFFMTILDGTITLAALPSIQAQLGMDEAAAQSTLTAYTVSFGGLLVLSGRAADRFGSRRVFLLGVGLRCLSAVFAGLARTSDLLIAARVAQGISAAVIAPAALSILMGAFPEGAQRNRALGIWAGIGGFGATAGLLLGGVLTDVLGWRWVFWVNVPVAIGVLLLSPRVLPKTGRRSVVHPMGLGAAVVLSMALASLVAGIATISPSGPTDSGSVALLLGCAALMTSFVVIERRTAYPLFSRTLLRSRNRLGGNLLLGVVGMAVDGLLVTLTGYVQVVQGWSALQFGTLACCLTVTTVGGSVVSQRLATAYGCRVVAGVGVIVMAAGGFMLSRVGVDAGSLVLVVGALLVFGLGMSAAFVCAQISALSGVPAARSGVAAAFADTSFAIGTALGVVVSVTTARLASAASGRAGAQALLAGEQTAFLLVIAFSTVGLMASMTLSNPSRDERQVGGAGADTPLRSTRNRSHDRPEPRSLRQCLRRRHQATGRRSV